MYTKVTTHNIFSPDIKINMRTALNMIKLNKTTRNMGSIAE